MSFMQVTSAQPSEPVVASAVKLAEDGQGLIVRLFNTTGEPAEVTLGLTGPISQAWRTNLLEENQETIAPADGKCTLALGPHAIETIRLLPG
jgi:alpha-mannosidase